MIPQSEYFDKDIANADNTFGYYIIEKGDFVYNPRKSTEAPFGPVSVYEYNNTGIVSPLYLCFKPLKSINTDFYKWFFKSPAWHRYIYMSGDSGARHDRVSMRDDVFFSMPLSIPNNAEQEKISAFLSILDERIKKQQQLIDSLKLYKRGVSNALFTQKISFEDKSSEWTATTMGKVCNITMGQSPDSDSYNTDNVGLPLVQGNADMKNRITHPQRYTSSPIKTAEIGDVILSVRAPVGTTGRANKKICLGRGVCSINGENNDFLYHYFVENEAYWKRVEQGGTFTAISGNDIANMPIFLPSNEEIEKITFFLNLIDDRISATEETLESLFEMKRSLLQQMFI